MVCRFTATSMQNCDHLAILTKVQWVLRTGALTRQWSTGPLAAWVDDATVGTAADRATKFGRPTPGDDIYNDRFRPK